MFKRMMSTLKGQIEFFCYHKREVIVLAVLWGEIKRKNTKLAAHERRDALIEMINNLCEEEIHG